MRKTNHELTVRKMRLGVELNRRKGVWVSCILAQTFQTRCALCRVEFSTNGPAKWTHYDSRHPNDSSHRHKGRGKAQELEGGRML